MKKKQQIKIKPLNSKFFNDLANKIHNPKTDKFLRLCSGSLTNGPDPTNKKRKMHCGLGELYFAMTGQHTHFLEEEDVIQKTMNNLPMGIKREQDKKRINNLIASLKNVGEIKHDLQNCIEDVFEEHTYTSQEKPIYDILEKIPDNNDYCGDYVCDSDLIYKERSKRIAKDFRDIAKKLAIKKK